MSGTFQPQLIESQANDWNVTDIDRIRCPVFREQGDLLNHGLLRIKKLDGLLPRGFLGAVEFTQVEHVSLGDASIAQPPILNDGPVEMLFAVFDPFAAA